MGRSVHRAEVTRRRKRDQQAARARETQASQRAAAAAAAWQVSRRRQVIALVLIAVGVIVGLSHLLQHLGLYKLMASGMADLLIGYPTAFVLAIVGLMRLPRSA